MMRLTNGKNGSALLIVLGMLSFMVVSAVGFAVYMRQSRAPSSHLRRESTARYLLKSALANAISRLDGELNDNGWVEGVYTDPYPGVGPAQNESDWQNGDLWTHRVFTPFGLTNVESTVSTLTLEGLAYLPPAVINEARVYSRLTKTAVWKNLSYDLGRYAFTAIDVSDCFDINRVRASERRSSAPGQRVNMSSLIESNAAQLDTILDQADPPLVSLADFNLLGNGSPFAPFSSYVGSAGGEGYLKGTPANVSNALFIVDTWFPPTNRTGSTATEVHDILAGSENQPFRNYGATSFLDLAKTGSQTELGKILGKNLGVGLACLYDYLDEDQIPISLALPTVEVAPMVCALGLANAAATALTPKVETVADSDLTYTKVGADGKSHTMKRTFTKHVYKGVDASSLMLTGVAAFPFKRVDSARMGSFKVEAIAAVFMADESLLCRLDDSSPIRPTQAEWSASGGTERDGILFFKGETSLPAFSTDIAKTTDALKQFAISLQAPNGSESSLYFDIEDVDITPMSQRDESFKAIATRTFKTADSTSENAIVYDKNGVRIKATTLYTGERKDELIKDDKRLSNGEDQNEITFTGTANYRLTVAVWVRVLNGSDVVDLAPAVFKDDMEMLQGVNYSGLESNNAMLALCGKGVPILDFVTDRTFQYNDSADGFAKLDGTAATYTGWTDLYAADPRFNFAPEDWFGKAANGDATPTSWLEALGANASTGSGGVFGSDGRDTDIFMFTSDQEYLQSMGELAFIPNLQTMDGSAELIGRGSDGYNTDIGRYDGNNNFASRTWSSVANKAFIWKTYTPVSHSGSGTDYIYELTNDGNDGHGSEGKEIIAGSGDFRANPFSPDSRILAAVVKDTPYDYYVASTNAALSVLSKTASVSESQKYAFGPNSTSSSALWTDGEDEELSGILRRGFLNYAKEIDVKADWMAAFSDKFAWYDGKTGDEQTSLFGSTALSAPLHGVDRKFLYSFWRECFQNRQQLFLVFIRAEPLTVGGASGDAISNSQLGARGVALVWRDPEPPLRSSSSSSSSSGRGSAAGGVSRRQFTVRSDWRKDLKDYGPHRTRVLFYHQFD